MKNGVPTEQQQVIFLINTGYGSAFFMSIGEKVTVLGGTQIGVEREVYMKAQSKYKGFMLVLIILSIFSLIFAVCFGSVFVHPGMVVKVIASKIPFFAHFAETEISMMDLNIVWKMRLPRVLLGFIVGASLAVCGVCMQALVRNKLADPFILGVSSGASAFASMFMVFGIFGFLGRFALPLTAFGGAFLSIVFIYLIARVGGRINIPQILLAGVAVSMIMDAVTTYISIAAPNAFKLYNVSFWLSGSLMGAKWEYLTLPTFVMVVCLTYLLIRFRALNVLMLGEETAGTLGINPISMQRMLIFISSLLAGVTISVSGSIGFIGMMVPHICRLLTGSDHKRVLPFSALLGGILVVWADVVARTIVAPDEIAVGVITAFVGAPFFLIILKNKNATRTMS